MGGEPARGGAHAVRLSIRVKRDKSPRQVIQGNVCRVVARPAADSVKIGTFAGGFIFHAYFRARGIIDGAVVMNLESLRECEGLRMRLPDVRVAESCVGTRALGPGLRSAVWVQGCPFRCRGCIAPDWIPQRPAREVRPDDLAAELLADPAVTGLTFSGGEPMAQATALAAVIRAARRKRDVTLICFTGYRLGELGRRPPDPGVGDLLAETDVLIDGRYVAARNDNRGLRGSDNQRVHMLTDRLSAVYEDLAGGPRRTEIRLRERSAMLVGVPDQVAAGAFGVLASRGQR